MPPRPIALASAPAHKRRVRSSKTGRSASNFALMRSATAFTRPIVTAQTPKRLDYFGETPKLALECSYYVNGVARIHQLVSQDMFPTYRMRAVTNGVHSVTWSAPAMQDLFDRHIPEWRYDNAYLRYASDIPLEEPMAFTL